MKEYTDKEIAVLLKNPYTYRVTKYKLYFTVKFKEKFLKLYQAGETPREILSELGYDLTMFSQDKIDSIAKSIRRRAASKLPFHEGENNTNKGSHGKRRRGPNLNTVEGMQKELIKLRQEIEFLKKIQFLSLEGK